MRTLLFYASLVGVLTFCWFAYEKVDKSDTVELKKNVADLQAQVQASVKASKDLQENERTTLRVLFPQAIEQIDTVFANGGKMPPEPTKANAEAEKAPAK